MARSLPLPLLLLPLVAALAAVALALPASLLRDVRRAEQSRLPTLKDAGPPPPPLPPPQPQHRPDAHRASDNALLKPKPASAARPGLGLDLGPSEAAGRPKRELAFDPEQLLALLALWRQQQQQQQHLSYRPPEAAATAGGWLAGFPAEERQYWSQPGDSNDLSEEEDYPGAGIWLPPPPPPPPSYAASKRETAWGGLAKAKRFMVSRKRQVGGQSAAEARYLASLLPPPPPAGGPIPLVRRLLL